MSGLFLAIVIVSVGAAPIHCALFGCHHDAAHANVAQEDGGRGHVAHARDASVSRDRNTSVEDTGTRLAADLEATGALLTRSVTVTLAVLGSSLERVALNRGESSQLDAESVGVAARRPPHPPPRG